MTALAIFQSKHGLEPDGKIGPITAKKIKEAFKLSERAAAHFIGQCYIETGGFKFFFEDLNYKPERLAIVWPSRFAQDPRAEIKRPNELAFKYAHKPESLANLVYANRNGNGDTESGDGWRFRGAGPTHLTGRANYQRAQIDLKGRGINIDLMARPELAGGEYAFEIADSYFRTNGVYAIGEKGTDTLTCSKVSRKVNLGNAESKTAAFYEANRYDLTLQALRWLRA